MLWSGADLRMIGPRAEDVCLCWSDEAAEPERWGLRLTNSEWILCIMYINSLSCAITAQPALYRFAAPFAPLHSLTRRAYSTPERRASGVRCALHTQKATRRRPFASRRAQNAPPKKLLGLLLRIKAESNKVSSGCIQFDHVPDWPSSARQAHKHRCVLDLGWKRGEIEFQAWFLLFCTSQKTISDNY